MIKRFLFILLSFGEFVFAQTQSIELPDFIITGNNSVTIPELEKSAPEVIANFSPKTFDLTFKKEDFPTPQFSEPKLLSNQQDTLLGFKSGKISISSGYYIQPEGDFIYSTGVEHVLFNVNLFGKNISDYEKYSRYNISGIDGKLNFFISPKSIIFPGTKFYFNGKFITQEYRLFGSNNPIRIRKNDLSGTLLSFENSYSNNFNYSLIFHANKLEMKSDSLQNIEVKVEPNILIKFNGFKLYSKAEIVTNKVYSNNSDYNSYQKFLSFIELSFIKNTLMKLGAEFSRFANSNYPKFYLEISYKLDNQILFEGKFKPFVQYNNHFDFLAMNPYYKAGKVNYTVENHKLFSEITFGYNYKDIIQINSSLSFDQIDSLLFIDDFQKLKEFTISTVSDVWHAAANINAALKTKLLGKFYLNSKWQTFYNKAKYYLPGYPDFTFNFIHDIPLLNSLSLISSLEYNDGIYFDFQSAKKFPAQINLDLTFNYIFVNNFILFVRFDNLLNKQYYVYENYKVKPLDIIAGFEYQW